jgi:hypothetical protein
VFRRLSLAALVVLLPTLAAAQADSLTVLRSLAGRWQGELQYRDYRDDSRQAIPLTVVHELVGGGDYLLRRLVFTDPGREVHAVELVTVERDRATLVISHFRDRKHSVEEYTIQEQEITDPEHWRLVLVASGQDDDRLALIRLTQTRDGDAFTAVKDVQYLPGGAPIEWEYRNSVTLRKVP